MKLAVTLALLVSSALLCAAEPQTEIRFLSGHGPKDAVPWEFSVTGGRRAGEWATIPVPSQWELHGFGTYNYGQEKNKSELQKRKNIPMLLSSFQEAGKMFLMGRQEYLSNPLRLQPMI